MTSQREIESLKVNKIFFTSLFIYLFIIIIIIYLI